MSSAAAKEMERAHALIAEAERLVSILVERRNALGRGGRAPVQQMVVRARSRSPPAVRAQPAARERSRSPPPPARAQSVIQRQPAARAPSPAESMNLEEEIVEPPPVMAARPAAPISAPARVQPAAPVRQVPVPVPAPAPRAPVPVPAPMPQGPAPGPARVPASAPAHPAQGAAARRAAAPERRPPGPSAEERRKYPVLLDPDRFKALTRDQASYLARMERGTVQSVLGAVPDGTQDPFDTYGGVDIATSFDHKAWIQRWKEVGLVDDDGPVEDAVVAYLRRHPTAFKHVMRVNNLAVRRAEQRINMGK